jgi:hypothetical protein
MILNLKITNFIRLKIFQIDLFGFNLLKQFYSFISKSPFMDIALLCTKPSLYFNVKDEEEFPGDSIFSLKYVKTSF